MNDKIVGGPEVQTIAYYKNGQCYLNNQKVGGLIFKAKARKVVPTWNWIIGLYFKTKMENVEFIFTSR